MKITLIVTLFFLVSLPCFAKLTEEDVNQIRQIIREEIEPVKKEMATMKGEIQALKITIAEMDKRIEAQFKAVDSRFDAVDSKFDAIDGKISIIQWFIGGLVAITVFAVGIPQLLIAYREKRESRLSKELDELKQEIAALKEKKIIT